MGSKQLDIFGMSGGAEFSACERYRYRLWRSWGPGKRCTFVMRGVR